MYIVFPSFSKMMAISVIPVSVPCRKEHSFHKNLESEKGISETICIGKITMYQVY